MVTMSINTSASFTKKKLHKLARCATADDKFAYFLSPPSISNDCPNIILYRKLEKVMEMMLSESNGVPVRTIKHFLNKIPSVFTGLSLISWLIDVFGIETQQEALHLANLLCTHGYLFPVEGHQLIVRNDSTYYRFQTPYFWPSNCWDPDNTEYAIYLCKRTMQNKTRLELSDYEAENLARLQKLYSRKWEFIFMQAEAQSKVDKKRDAVERAVLDSQERAFWDVHRPMPNTINTTEVDIRKLHNINSRMNRKKREATNIAGTTEQKRKLRKQILNLRDRLEFGNVKSRKIAESLTSYCEQYTEYDWFLTAQEYSNPWISDSTEWWEIEGDPKEVTFKRVKRWAFSLQELLNDSIGRSQFENFLDREYSRENLMFWDAVQELKALPLSQVKDKVLTIWTQYLAADATCLVNIDSHSYELTKNNVEKHPDRWSFDIAVNHVYNLMRSDSYSRFLRSDIYKELYGCANKRSSAKGLRSLVSFPVRKDNNT